MEVEGGVQRRCDLLRPPTKREWLKGRVAIDEAVLPVGEVVEIVDDFI